MTYTPINWQTGDTITAEKLNRCDNGWSVESTQLLSETVTTVSQDGFYVGTLTYSGFIDSDTIIVTFDGTDYTCSRMSPSGAPFADYGASWNDDLGEYDFSEFPFCLFSEEVGSNITTQVAGEHTIAVKTSDVNTGADFQTAVDSIVDTSTMPMECVSQATTYSDMSTAFNDGRILFFKPYQGSASMRFITDFTDTSVTFIPADSAVSASISNGFFAVTLS